MELFLASPLADQELKYTEDHHNAGKYPHNPSLPVQPLVLNSTVLTKVSDASRGWVYEEVEVVDRSIGSNNVMSTRERSTRCQSQPSEAKIGTQT
eukprot:12151188-Ditylum_brightwellii.AAC.1